jgi:hypothetical protein
LTGSRYRLDGDDVIRWVSGGWIHFAKQNTDGSWDPESVVGHSIWSYIEGPEVRHLYELLLRRVRTAGVAIEVPFRCDGPDVRRDMRLRIEPLENEGVQLTVAFPRETPAGGVGGDGESSLPERTVRPKPELVPLCSWCDRVLVRGMGWVNVEVAVEAMDLFDGGPVPKLSHGACPDCYADVMVVDADTD